MLTVLCLRCVWLVQVVLELRSCLELLTSRLDPISMATSQHMQGRQAGYTADTQQELQLGRTTFNRGEQCCLHALYLVLHPRPGQDVKLPP